MSNAKVLVIHDLKHQLDTLVAALTYAGYNCCKATTAQEALDWLEALPDIDVVVSDVRRPDCDDVDFVGLVRDRFPGRSWIQTVMLTACASPEIVEIAVRAGVIDLLFTPVKREQLLAAVSDALGRATIARRKSLILQNELMKYSSLSGHSGLFYPSVRVSDTESYKRETGGSDCTDVPPLSNANLLQILQANKLKTRIFPDKLFIETSWNMLLELLECHLSAIPTTLSQVYTKSGAPHATASRRLAEMEAAGMVERYVDPRDARRHFVRLTKCYSDKLILYFSLLTYQVTDASEQHSNVGLYV